MFCKAVGKFGDVAPVCRLLVWDVHVGGSDLHDLRVAGHVGDTDLGFQQLHPLQAFPMERGNVDGMEGRNRRVKDAIDEVHGAVLE